MSVAITIMSQIVFFRSWATSSPSEISSGESPGSRGARITGGMGIGVGGATVPAEALWVRDGAIAGPPARNSSSVAKALIRFGTLAPGRPSRSRSGKVGNAALQAEQR